MEPIEIQDEEVNGGRRSRLAEGQPQYQNLPGVLYSETGVILSRWHLTEEERGAILDGANIDLWVWTFGKPFQPVNLGVQGVTYNR